VSVVAVGEALLANRVVASVPLVNYPGFRNGPSGVKPLE
jgi:hypothetical protein